MACSTQRLTSDVANRFGSLSDNVIGAGFMVAAMVGFSLEDMFLKAGSSYMPVGQVLALHGLVGVIFFAFLARARGEAVLHRQMLSPSMALRALFESSGRLFYTIAIAYTALSNASAIMQATPLVVVAGAALFLGEKVGWRRWLAIWIGFIGVLMILRPGAAAFDWASALAVLGMLGFAGRDLATRIAPRGLSNAQIGICGYSILVPTGLALLLFDGAPVVPGLEASVMVLGAAIFGVAAYVALTEAMRTGEVSFVTPFRYSRILFGVGLGMIVFAERPDAMTYAGALVVLLSGLYIMARQRAQE